MLSKKLDQATVKEKVNSYRIEQGNLLTQKKTDKAKKLAEQNSERIKKREALLEKRLAQKEQEKQEIETLISTFLENSKEYSQYEFNEVKKNKTFFQLLPQRVLEQNEKALTFIFCEYDKSSKKEIKGYLIPTNKRVLFLTKDLNHMEKFRYQTIINVNSYKDGIFERELRIQYGKRKLEFDEIFDQEQMKKVGNTILNQSTTKV
ncbi:PH domain-containing protein [Solibacillus sp. FSL W7-1472]|uniref:PH domain-containing protein n=2 Tax=Solibacillus TaxID=648800 RepID=UPI0018D4BB1C|nr:PH domain-containing protein [Solibacillus silvestris]